MPAGRPHDGTGDLSYQRRDCMSSLLGRHGWRSAACLSVIVRFLPHHLRIAEARCPMICRQRDVSGTFAQAVSDGRVTPERPFR